MKGEFSKQKQIYFDQSGTFGRIQGQPRSVKDSVGGKNEYPFGAERCPAVIVDWVTSILLDEEMPAHMEQWFYLSTLCRLYVRA